MRSVDRQRKIYVLTAVGAVCIGVFAAVSRAWLADDAFISFRYADNLTNGLGLVFNAGERVEGYTNLLWTLYLALGILLGVTPETTAHVTSIACFAALLALLAARSIKQGRFPVAAVCAVAHLHMIDFATSGLETSLFSLLILGGYLLLVPARGSATRRQVGAAGLVFALASITRPDGALLAVIGGLALLPEFLRTRDVKRLLFYAGGFLIVWAPVTAWRIYYYGDFWPNTYYAKSATLAWWSQGWTYTGLYFERYWPLLLAPLASGLVLRQARAQGRTDESYYPFAVELAMVTTYTLAVTRVGGDFMFGRLLVPITPLLLLMLERAVCLGFVRPQAAPLFTAGTVVALLLSTPNVGTDESKNKGIVDERIFYEVYEDGKWVENCERKGAILREAFAKLPVRICFFGGEARRVYRSRVATAIECHTGLTDSVIARQKITERGRVGHEKKAPIDYVFARGVNFVFMDHLDDELDREIPNIPVDIGGVPARLVSWDSTVEALRRRGAEIPDVPHEIDEFLADAETHTDSEVTLSYSQFKRLYFDHVKDPARATRFQELVRKRQLASAAIAD